MKTIWTDQRSSVNPNHKKYEGKKIQKVLHTIIKLLKPDYKNEILRAVRDKHLQDREIMDWVTAVYCQENASQKTEKQKL